MVDLTLELNFALSLDKQYLLIKTIKVFALSRLNLHYDGGFYSSNLSLCMWL